MFADQASFFDAPIAELGDLGVASSLLALMEAPGIGSAKAIALARSFGSWQSLRTAEDDALTAVAGKVAAGIQNLRLIPPPELPEGVRVVGFFDDDYPEALRRIPNPPAVLWVRGTLPTALSIAIVGTRNPTESGNTMADLLSRTAVGAGWGVVSGLALGIDIAAHRAALDAQGKTWAFLGSGIDQVTPTRHSSIAEEIVASGGGLIAEVPPGVTTAARHLVARNRLQSGSSQSTIVVQTGVPSGTLHTARFTIEQGRILAVVQAADSEMSEPRWRGNLALLDPSGCEASVLSATGVLAKTITKRQPVADRSISCAEDLVLLLQELEA